MNMEKAIGGYFGLELQSGEGEYYSNLNRFNTARNAICYVLKKRNCQKVYVPIYTCGVIIDAIKRINIEIEFYNINNHLEIGTIPSLKSKEFLIYTNYFGFKDNYINQLTENISNLIIDNAQAFFSAPFLNYDTIYCPRKFFGLSDGAYLSTKLEVNETFEKDESAMRFNHLLKRIDKNAEAGYEDFRHNESLLAKESVKHMSNLTEAILKYGIDYHFASNQRNLNYLYLHKNLKDRNLLQIEFNDDLSPMVYPLLVKSNNLKAELIKNRIYVATYWPDVLKRCKTDSFEYYLTSNLVALPIDHRYTINDMEKIVKVIIEYGK